MAKKIRCPKCNSIFIWNETNSISQCQNCGTRYRMKQTSQPVLMPSVGRGQTDYLTVPNESIIANMPLIKTYIPQNWSYQCRTVSDRFDMVSNPIVISVAFLSPDRSAKIVFTGESFYKHIDFTPQTAHLQNRLEDMTVSRSPSFLRLKSFMNASEYCNALAQSCNLNSLSVINQKNPDNAELQRQETIIQNFLSKGFMNAQADWVGKTYSGTSPNGSNLKIYAETRVIQLSKISNVSSLQMQPAPSVFGIRMVPQMVNRQIQEFFWDTQYEFTLLAAAPKFDYAYSELQRIIKTLDYLPGMQQARANALSLAANVQMNIAGNQAASLDRQSKIIADTNAYTSNIQHQMFADNAASHNRTANRYSEMINEVNTYNANGGVVQASTNYDHVYQNTRYPDIYAAQQGNSLEFGVDFVELERNDGNY